MAFSLQIRVQKLSIHNLNVKTALFLTPWLAVTWSGAGCIGWHFRVGVIGWILSQQDEEKVQ